MAETVLTYSYDSARKGYTVTKATSIVDGKVEIPEKYDDGTNGIHFVTKIAESAFVDCSNLQTVSLPNELTIIEKGAFENCSKLEEITLPSKMQTIEDRVFQNCTSLGNVVIPSNIRHIGKNAFSKCEKLEEVSLPSALEKIDDEAFLGCGLRTITIPSRVFSLGKRVFKDNTNLTEFVFSNNLNSWGQEIFSNTGLSRVVFHGVYSDFEDYKDSLFANFSNLTVVYDTIRPIADLDFLGFTFNGYHSIYDLNVYRTSEGSRYNDNLIPQLNEKTTPIPGNDGMYYFNTNYTAKLFSVKIAFDNLTEAGLRKLRKVFNGKEMGDLIFDETPYKVYSAKVTGSSQLSYLPFDYLGTRIYKGDGTIQFTAYYPYAHTPNTTTKVSRVLQTQTGQFGQDGRDLDSYPYNEEDPNYMLYPTKPRWKIASGLRSSSEEQFAIGMGENLGDIPATFVLKFNTWGMKNLVFTVGDKELFLPSINTGDQLQITWNTKTGLVTAKAPEQDVESIIQHTGNSCILLPVGPAQEIFAQFQDASDTYYRISLGGTVEKLENEEWQVIEDTQYKNCTLVLEYDYWYY